MTSHILELDLNCSFIFIILNATHDRQSFRQNFKRTLVCPEFQTTSVRASRPSHRDSPVQTLAPFRQTPLQQEMAECTEPHSKFYTHTTNYHTYGNLKISQDTHTSLFPTVQVFHNKWQLFQKTIDTAPHPEKT